MDTQAVSAWVDTLVFTKTGEHLNDLQKTILQQVWQGHKYLNIAAYYGCTEGHIKDVASELWKLLSKHLGEKITKSNCRTALARYLQADGQVAVPHASSMAVATEVLEGSQIARNNFVSAAVLPVNLEKINFVGRVTAIAYLNTLLSQGAKVIVLQGEGGLGKTTLAQQYLHQGFELVLELLMAKETHNITSAERIVEEWLKQDFEQEPSIEFGINLGRLKRQLQTRRVGVLIDNIEPALDQQGRLLAPHRNYVELFRVLADPLVQSVTLITSRDRLCESGLNVQHYRLPGLEQSAWQQFFSNRGITIAPSTIQRMHQAYGGNAKAMGILCGVIQEDFSGDMTAYWRASYGDLLVTADLKDLIASQVNRLQVLDPQAYRLFCRLGCYRYQDVPATPTQGLLCLLWDVPNSQHRQIITSLRNRSLVECNNGEYWLHPVIQAEAIARLRASDEWETANHKAAEFWTNSVQTIETAKDAIQAMEAYYHYVEIGDFGAASRVILKSRDNQWRQFLPLGSTLYRMGLLQPVFTAITQVIHYVQSDSGLSELYNILGDLFWIQGNINKAISCQEETIFLAVQALSHLPYTEENKRRIYYLKMLEVDSLLSIGLYKVDLWDLEAAVIILQKVINVTKNTHHQRWAVKASVCLALAKSYLGLREEACSLADVIYHTLLSKQLIEQTGRFAYFIQILGQTYINLGNFEKGNELCHQALTYAEVGHYTQIKAKTLNGLAEIHRQQNAFEAALVQHLEAINLLDGIGARCDLAEAYFQLGLTHQKMGNSDGSKTSFDKATQLFTDMQAPRQVEKVLRVTN